MKLYVHEFCFWTIQCTLSLIYLFWMYSINTNKFLITDSGSDSGDSLHITGARPLPSWCSDCCKYIFSYLQIILSCEKAQSLALWAVIIRTKILYHTTDFFKTGVLEEGWQVLNPYIDVQLIDYSSCVYSGVLAFWMILMAIRWRICILFLTK